MTKWAYLAKGLQPPEHKPVPVRQGEKVDISQTWRGIAISTSHWGSAKTGPCGIAYGLGTSTLQAGDGGLLVSFSFTPAGDLRLEAAKVGGPDGLKPDTPYYFQPGTGWIEVPSVITAPSHVVIKRKVSA